MLLDDEPVSGLPVHLNQRAGCGRGSRVGGGRSSRGSGSGACSDHQGEITERCVLIVHPLRLSAALLLVLTQMCVNPLLFSPAAQTSAINHHVCLKPAESVAVARDCHAQSVRHQQQQTHHHRHQGRPRHQLGPAGSLHPHLQRSSCSVHSRAFKQRSGTSIPPNKRTQGTVPLLVIHAPCLADPVERPPPDGGSEDRTEEQQSDGAHEAEASA